MQNYQAIIKTPIGKLGIRASAEFLMGIAFLDNNAECIKPKTVFTKTVVEQLTAYFTDASFKFSLPVKSSGTAFQEKVWQAMTQIPAGKTVSYGQLATRLKTGPRAIGGACRRNPIPIVVPCHRIVAANNLGGFSGEYASGRFINIKKWLLQHEK